MQRIALGALGLAGAALLAPLGVSGDRSATAQDAEPGPVSLERTLEDHFPTPGSPLAIAEDIEGRMTLEGLLREFTRATGQNLHATPYTRELLASTPIGLYSGVEVPPEEVYSFVESLLFQYGFVVSELRAQSPPLLAIQSLDDNETQSNVRFVEVDHADIEAYRDHPALLVQCVVPTQGLDNQQLSNYLRATFARNSAYQWLLPMGVQESLLVRTTGSEAAAIASMVAQAASQAEAKTKR